MKLTPAISRIGPRQYLFAGIWLFAIKFALDRFIATIAFARPWSLYNYLFPHETAMLPFLPAKDRPFYGTMLLVALPFIAIGTALTWRRLRDADLPTWLVVTFFIPFVNLLFFTVLGFLPTVRRDDRPSDAPHPVTAAAAVTLDYGHDELKRSGRMFSKLFPENALASACVAALVPLPFAAGLTLLAATIFRDYGWGIFVGLPFCIGLLAAVLHGYRAPRTAGQCIAVGCASLLICGVALIAFAIEGLGCLILLLPLAFPIAVLGSAVGYTIQARPDPDGAIRNTLWSVSIALPLLIGAESLPTRNTSTFAVTTSVVVDAPISRVWHNVVSFSEIPPPSHWVFRAGIAYPVRARIDRMGVGAIRRCEFSTGPFVEPITAWEEPTRLAFSVTSNPPPMREWSPFNIHPPHLENFLVSHAGQFRLTSLPDGRTHLEGTTWYEHRLFPEAYWKLWSDFIIHRIHQRVLEHVKHLSESAPPA
jgi:uncharacterized membrane protein YhaH (DUF805 family)